MRVRLGERVLTYVILAVFSLSALLPLLGVALTALTPQDEGSATLSLPSRLAPGNLVQAWTTSGFSNYLTSSAIVAGSVVLASTVLAIPAAFAFAKLRFAGQTVLFYLCIVGLTVPQEAYVIATYFTFRTVGITDTYLAVILPQIAQSLSFGIFWLRNFFVGMPDSLIEAARLDGAPDRAVLWRVVAPLARPAILTMVMLVFMWTWNDFLWSLVMISSESLRTAPLALTFFQGRYLTNFPLLAAAAVLVALPIVVLYLILQRYFIRGLLSGAVK